MLEFGKWKEFGETFEGLHINASEVRWENFGVVLLAGWNNLWQTRYKFKLIYKK